MAKTIKNLAVFALIFGFLGCTVRMYEVEKPRKDLEVSGNQGYLYGSPPAPKPPAKVTRKITVVEWELGKPVKLNVSKQASKEISIEQEEGQENVLPESSETEFMPQSQEVEIYKLYTVKKNDTLQKISYKFYNTTRKWKKIYNANKDILKSPDEIRPGQVLKIP